MKIFINLNEKIKKMELGDFYLEYFVDEDLSIDCFSVLDNYFNLIIN